MAEPPLTSPPPADASSTPITSDNPFFSDEPFVASSPPSSPPEFPWEKASNKKYSKPRESSNSTVSAFSVLGKRKTLASISDNARSAKRPTPATPTKDGKPLTQMQISIGQEVQKKCKVCGMEYIASSDEDRKLHDKYHKQNTEGYDVGKEFLPKARKQSVFETSRKDDVIASVDATDSLWRRKRARTALDVVQRELGAVDIPDEQLWKTSMQHLPADSSLGRYTVYMYVRQNKCIGLLLAEQITEARKVLELAKPPLEKKAPAKAKMSALERLRAKHASQKANDSDVAQPIQLATKPTPAVLGVSRIWVSPSHRGQSIAEVLLDRSLQHHNERVSNIASTSSIAPDHPGTDTKETESNMPILEKITKHQVAFSQPTDAGAKLARKWSGRKYGWLVYID